MLDKDQLLMFNRDELSLLKNTFAENDALLYTVRKVFLQQPLLKSDKDLIQRAITPDVFKLLKRRILPKLSAEFPLGQIPSLLSTLTDQIKVKDVEEMYVQFQAKKLEQEYLENAFANLQAVMDGKSPSYNAPLLEDLAVLEGKSAEQMYIDVTVYLFLLGYIDPMLLMVKSLAGSKGETIEQQQKRLTRNSNK